MLKKPQIGLSFQAATYRGFVKYAVGLRSGGTNRRPFRAVQDSKLNTSHVSGQSHGATHGVQLFHKMAFAYAADGRVAAHLTQGFNIVREQQGTATHARSSKRSLGTGMTAADHQHIETVWINHGHLTKQMILCAAPQ